jgi:coenzyme Q-binding protein COQ10
MPTHAEQRVLPYSQEELYKLVADVESYPDFLPWCVACRVTSRKDDIILADLVIGYKMVREKLLAFYS